MTEESNETARAVYRNAEIDYDVSKLNAEAQQAFMLLAKLQQGELREAEINLNILRAAQAQFNSIIQDNLSDEAKMAEPAPVPIEGESQEDS